MFDPVGEEGDLHLWGAGVFFVSVVFFDYLGF
jgi:hypothetical protein